MARDKELMVVVDQSGELLAIDIGFARLKAFTTPIPVISVGRSALSAEELKTAKAAFLSRGSQPMPRSTNPNHIFPIDHANTPDDLITAGDFTLYTEAADGSRLQVGEFDRDVIRTQLYNAEAILASVAFALSPPDDADKVVGKISELMDDSGVAAKLTAVTGLSEGERTALRSLPVQNLLARAQANRAQNRRDKYSRDEWQDYAATAIERAKTVVGQKAPEKELRAAAERGELGDFWQAEAVRTQNTAAGEFNDPRPLWYRLLSSKRVRILAGLTAGGGAALGYSAQTAWGVHLLNVMYENYFPGVLKDSAYRATLLKSSLTLGAFLPLTYILGMVISTKTGFTPIKSLAYQMTKIYAELILPFWHRISGLVRQPNFLRALAEGISPLAKVKADSAIGRRLGLNADIRPGISNPLKSLEARRASEAQGVKVLNALVEQKDKIRSLAWILALQAASAEAGVDPATLATLMSSETYLKAQLDLVANKPEFVQKWKQLASELEIEFTKIGRDSDIDSFSQIKLEDLNMYLQVMRARAKEIKSRGKVERLLAGLKARWLSVRTSTMTGFATFGKDEYNFLREATPSDPVTALFWKQYVVDYSLSVGQIGLFGPRANLKDPQALAANKHSFLWTSAGHRFDMIDQIRIYLLSVAASFMLSYQNPAQVRETGYDPIENISMEGRRTNQTLMAALKTWGKEAFDPTRADEYGQRAIRGFVRSFRTMQFNISMSLAARILAAGQPIGAALGSYSFFFLGGKWGYAWPWDIINMGSLRYDEKFANARSSLIDARAKIAQGLRLNDAELLKSGYAELSQLYVESDVTLPSLEKLQESLEALSNADLQELRMETAPYLAAFTELRRAIHSGSANRLASARSALETIYRAHGLNESAAAFSQLGNLNLLEFSLKNPPFETHGNAVVPWIATTVGALSTTYLATFMGVFTFRGNVNWLEIVPATGVASAGLYAAYYFGTKFIGERARAKVAAREKAANERKAIESQFSRSTDTTTTAPARGGSRLVRSCEAVFG